MPQTIPETPKTLRTLKTLETHGSPQPHFQISEKPEQTSCIEEKRNRGGRREEEEQEHQQSNIKRSGKTSAAVSSFLQDSNLLFV